MLMEKNDQVTALVFLGFQDKKLQPAYWLQDSRLIKAHDSDFYLDDKQSGHWLILSYF